MNRSGAPISDPARTRGTNTLGRRPALQDRSKVRVGGRNEAPNPKRQAPEKFQTPSSKDHPASSQPHWRSARVTPASFVVWRLVLRWSLELGIWSFGRAPGTDFRAVLAGHGAPRSGWWWTADRPGRGFATRSSPPTPKRPNGPDPHSRFVAAADCKSALRTNNVGMPQADHEGFFFFKPRSLS